MNLTELSNFKHKNVHVVGFSSVEGAAICRFLLNQGFTNITAHDFCKDTDFERQFMLVHVGMARKERQQFFNWMLNQPIRKRFGSDYLSDIENSDLIFATQAWFIYNINFPKLANAKEKGIPFCSITELYFDLVPCPIIGVTGTHGKSTTSRMIYEILSTTGKKIHFAGNERHNVQVLNIVDTMKEDDILLLEISNRQLRGLNRSPNVAVVTNIYPNHLDEHNNSFDDYIATKKSILEFQKKSDMAVLNSDNETVKSFGSATKGSLYWFSLKHPDVIGAFVENGEIFFRAHNGNVNRVGTVSQLPAEGTHNIENALAALTVGCSLGVANDKIWGVLASFRGIKHRMQYVRSINGIRFVDDLNSTTPHATLAAIRSIDGPIHLIVGGDDKGLDYDEFAEIVSQRVHTLILLPGKGSEKIELALSKHLTGQNNDRTPPVVKSIDTLEPAVEFAYKQAKTGETVLLSPACPYFYRMFYLDDSGEEEGYRTIVRNIAMREPIS